MSVSIREEVEQLSSLYQIFHWHIAFPDVFRVKEEREGKASEIDWEGGFDVVLGNPPWEKLQTEEIQFFSSREPRISKLKGSQRKQAISALKETEPALSGAWAAQRRFDAASVSFIRNSGCYPLTGVGKFNTFALFSELNRRILSENGQLGCIVPSEIATDDTTKLFFQDIVKGDKLISIYDFENREKIFPTVDSRFKFCLLSIRGLSRFSEDDSKFVFFAFNTEDIRNPKKQFSLSSRDILNLNPNTLTCPTFRRRRDAEINKRIYHKIPVFFNQSEGADNLYDPKVWRLMNTTDDSDNFLRLDDIANEKDLVPVIEAKMIHQFDHRYATYQRAGASNISTREMEVAEKLDPGTVSMARFYIDEPYFRKRLPEEYRQKSWFSTVRNITNSTNERTVIASILPKAASCEVTPYIEVVGDARSAAFLCSVLNSFVLDYAARQKVGGTHLSYFILYQLPVIPPEQVHVFQLEFFLCRILELTYTAYDIRSFAKDCGYNGPPFRWNESRRFLLRCELDAAYFLLYNIQRDDVDYIMETFPIVKRKDEKAHGHYRTKDTILQIYDAMTTAIETDQPYQTLLDPPPADPSLAHPPRPEDSP